MAAGDTSFLSLKRPKPRLLQLGAMALLIPMITLLLASPAGRPVGGQEAATVDSAWTATVLLAVNISVTESGQPAPGRQEPLGSGAVITADGLILTNCHVVDLTELESELATEAGGLKELEGREVVFEPDAIFQVYVPVSFEDPPQLRYTATVLDRDCAQDLAVLEVTGGPFGGRLNAAPDMAFLPIGDSETVNPLDDLRVYGYPDVGTATAFGRSVTFDEGEVNRFEGGVMWVDAQSDHGSSGGPAVDASGELVGVVRGVEEGDLGSRWTKVIPIDSARPLLERVRPDLYATPFATPPTETPAPPAATPTATATTAPPPTETPEPPPTDTPAPPTEAPEPPTETPQPEAIATDTVNVELILDSSGSMAEETTTGEPRIDAAKRVLTDVITQIPDDQPNINVGFRVFGHEADNTAAGRAESCQSSELLVPIEGVDKEALQSQVDSYEPVGWTPMALSLERAVEDFPDDAEDITNAIILVTDGLETCDDDVQAPCDAATELFEGDKGVQVNVVGLGLAQDELAILQCIADNGGGVLLGAQNAEELDAALSQLLTDLSIFATPSTTGEADVTSPASESPDNQIGIAPCDAESLDLGQLTAGEANYAFAGIETERTPADLLEVGTTGEGEPVYTNTDEQPFPELFIESPDGLQRYVLLDDAGLPDSLPEDLSTTLPNGTPIQLRFSGSDTEVDAGSLVRFTMHRRIPGVFRGGRAIPERNRHLRPGRRGVPPLRGRRRVGGDHAVDVPWQTNGACLRRPRLVPRETGSGAGGRDVRRRLEGNGPPRGPGLRRGERGSARP